MNSASRISWTTIGAALTALIAVTVAVAQGDSGSPLVETGQIMFKGRSVGYRIRNLPVSSFPDLPQQIADALTARSCLIPQTYEAHRPENVIHGSFEHAGSSDWAVLCSTKNKTSLLVFFAGSAAEPIVLVTSSNVDRLQPHEQTGQLGFAWGIDPASPHRVHDAQAGMTHRPTTLDHDCVADTTLDGKTIYRLYRNGTWETVPTE